MNHTDTPQQDEIAVLNRLLHVLDRSLARYLRDTTPWIRSGTEKALDRLADLAADQQAFAERVGRAIYARRGRIATGQFPMAFSAANDLAVGFLLKTALELHTRDVDTIGQCAEQLAFSPALRVLAEEVAANQREHLDKLKELAAHSDYAAA